MTSTKPSPFVPGRNTAAWRNRRWWSCGDIPALTAGERRRAVIARIRASLQKPEVPLMPSPEELVREDRER